MDMFLLSPSLCSFRREAPRSGSGSGSGSCTCQVRPAGSAVDEAISGGDYVRRSVNQHEFGEGGISPKTALGLGENAGEGSKASEDEKIT
jgi:hypothetical protein